MANAISIVAMVMAPFIYKKATQDTMDHRRKGAYMIQQMEKMLTRIHHSTRIPLVLVVVGMISVFVYQHDQLGFQQGHYGFLSSHGMALTSNLSAEHGFLLFNSMSKAADGSIVYEAYSRFPVFSFAIIRLFTYPFRHDLSMQIAVARQVMNVFFLAAMLIAYLSISRLMKSRWVAATAVLLSFSSYYCMQYHDMIFNDIPSMFGMLLVFHGMVMFVHEKRFFQLVFKAIIALCLGWQSYAILLPFIIMGCIRELMVSRSVRSVMRSPYFQLGVFALLWGVVLLGCNLASEYAAVGGPLQQLPTVQKLLFRCFGYNVPSVGLASLAEAADPDRQWPQFLMLELYRIGRMTVPHIMLHDVWAGTLFKSLGIVTLIVSLTSALWCREKFFAMTLVLSGLCWSLPMRNFVCFHDYQAIYYIGIPLIIFCVISRFAETRFNHLIIAGAGIVLILFTLSVVHMNATKVSAESNTITLDFERISKQIGVGHLIYVAPPSTNVGRFASIGGGYHAVHFYLAGNYFQKTDENVDFSLSDSRDIKDKVLLTPQNSKVFLYKHMAAERK
jgi:hypothetical protein